MASTKSAAPPHPHVTVDDVWRGALPKQTELVAGAAGSRREVVWCTALRARSPAFTPLRGGELLLINPQVLTAVDPRLTLARLLDSLAGQGVAGAAGPGRVAPRARLARAAGRGGGGGPGPRVPRGAPRRRRPWAAAVFVAGDDAARSGGAAGP